MTLLSRIFVKGLLTLLPITLTLYLLVWFTSMAEATFRDPLKSWLPASFDVPGAGVAIVVMTIFGTGLLVNYYLTQRFVHWMESKLEAMPLIKSIYIPLRDVTKLFAPSAERSQQRVVMVRLSGIEVMGLITRDSFDDLPKGTVPEGSVAVFIPFSYGVGGFTVVADKAAVRETNLTADKAMQLAITGWIKSAK